MKKLILGLTLFISISAIAALDSKKERLEEIDSMLFHARQAMNDQSNQSLYYRGQTETIALTSIRKAIVEYDLDYTKLHRNDENAYITDIANYAHKLVSLSEKYNVHMENILEMNSYLLLNTNFSPSDRLEMLEKSFEQEIIRDLHKLKH